MARDSANCNEGPFALLFSFRLTAKLGSYEQSFTETKRELFRVVQRDRQTCRPRRKFRGSRLHGDQALRLRDLGKNAARPGRYVQSDRARECLLPLVRSEIVP